MDICGVKSGRNVDKFAETGLTPEPATHVQAPLIKECPVNLECKVLGVISLGSHDLFIGDVLAMHAEEDIVLDKERGIVDPSGGLIFAMNAYWRFGEKIEMTRYTARR